MNYEREWVGRGNCLDCARNDGRRSPLVPLGIDRIQVSLIDGYLRKECCRCGGVDCSTVNSSVYDFSVHFDQREDRDWHHGEFGMFLSARDDSPFGPDRWYPAPWHEMRLGGVKFDLNSEERASNSGRFLEDAIQNLGLQLDDIYISRPVSGSPDSLLTIVRIRLCDMFWEARDLLTVGWFPSKIRNGEFELKQHLSQYA